MAGFSPKQHTALPSPNLETGGVLVGSRQSPMVTDGAALLISSEAKGNTYSVENAFAFALDARTLQDQSELVAQGPVEGKHLIKLGQCSEQVSATQRGTQELDCEKLEAMENNAEGCFPGEAQVPTEHIHNRLLSTQFHGQDLRVIDAVADPQMGQMNVSLTDAKLIGDRSKPVNVEQQSQNMEQHTFGDQKSVSETKIIDATSVTGGLAGAPHDASSSEHAALKADAGKVEAPKVAAEIQPMYSSSVQQNQGTSYAPSNMANDTSRLLNDYTRHVPIEFPPTMSSMLLPAEMKKAVDGHGVQILEPKIVTARSQVHNGPMEIPRESSNNLFKNRLFRLPNGDVIPLETYLQAASSFNLQRVNGVPSEDPGFMTPPQPKRRSGLYPTGTTSNNVLSHQMFDNNQFNGILSGNQNKQALVLPDRTAVLNNQNRQAFTPSERPPVLNNQSRQVITPTERALISGNHSKQAFTLPVRTSNSSNGEVSGSWKQMRMDNGSAAAKVQVDIPELSASHNGPAKFSIMDKLTLYDRKRKALVDQQWVQKQKCMEDTISMRYHELKVTL